MSEKEKVTDGDVVAEEVKHRIMVKEGHRHYAPQYIAIGVTIVQYIFSVPESNSVGTLDGQNNGIVFIKFGNYGADRNVRCL